MTLPILIAIAFAGLTLAIQAGSSGLAIWRCRQRKSTTVAKCRPPVSIIRPLRGLEHFSAETLRSSFTIDYPVYEILFCVHDASDPVIPLVKSLMAEYPERPSSLLIGDDRISGNPKLNNMAKGFYAAQFSHVVFADSNVQMPSHYLDSLAGRLDTQTGMVSAPPVGQWPEGFWAQVECAFLNSYQARIQYAVDSLGFGFAQGKTLFYRKADLERIGLEKLGSEPAEDAATTKIMRAQGRQIRLAGPFAQLIGPRNIADMWSRQLRWARLRRASFPLLFIPEICAGIVPPLLAVIYAAAALEAHAGSAAAIFAVLWYLPEILLIRLSGWPLSVPALVLRDLLLPVLYAAAWMGRSFAWHGWEMTAFSGGGVVNPDGKPRRLRTFLSLRRL